MGQSTGGVKRSLSSKLLASVAAILALVVGFLTLSSIILLKRDKMAYVFDAQATTCTLAGREFSAYIQSSLDLVKSALLQADPLKLAGGDAGAMAAAQRQTQFVLDNQSVSLSLTLGRFNPATAEWQPVVRTARAEAMRTAAVTDADLALSPATLKAYADTLASRGSAFINISQVGKPPLVAVALLDRKGAGETGMAYGVISLQAFQSGLPSSVGGLAIYNAQGDVLFHTDSSILFGSSLIHGREGVSSSSDADPIFQEAKAAKATSGAKEVEVAGKKYLSSFYRPGLDLVVSTRTETSQAMRPMYTLIEKLVFFGVLAIALAIAFSIIFAKSLTRPINQIYEATKEVAQGNFSVELPITSQDEVGALARAVTTMSRKIGDLVEEVGNKARMEQELAVASTVQSNLFPLPTYGDHQVRLKGYYKSATECGGDWWGFFRVGNRMAVLIADATGHGIPSALMTAAIRGSFSTIHKLFRSRPEMLQMTPREIIPLANAAVFESGRSGINMTFFIGILDFDKKEMVYANAAHCPPWFIAPEAGKAAKARMLMSAGPRLGETPEIEHVEEHTVAFKSGDTIVFYTDGLLEGKNPEGTMYGKKRSRKVVEANHARGEEQLVNAIVKDFLDFNGDKPLDDDLTLVAARIL